MKNKKKILHSVLILAIIIVVSFLSVKIAKLIDSIHGDLDYQQLELEIDEYDIDYYTVYDENIFGEYKVYKINNYYKGDGLDKIKQQLENSNTWSRNKFYEYIMKEFYEKIGKEIVEIDRENLYYYDKQGVYAIIDVKNSKLYYSSDILYYHQNYNEILGIKTNNYINREIYSVRGGLQNDGTDYYTYEFTEEKGSEIEEVLSKSQNWKKEKLDKKILDCFKYNEDVNSIENGYYHYKLVCRTSDENKKYNFTEEEATGWEIGVYDADKNVLYYYWTSYWYIKT